MEEYEKEYKEFMEMYLSSAITPEQVGGLIAKLAGYYPNYNLALVKAERAFSLVCRDEVVKTDEATGKPISSVKAETIANSSTESYMYKTAKAHVANLEMLIQSAKSLQRGLMQEMSHSNLG